jgi:hypothetical protein
MLRRPATVPRGTGGVADGHEHKSRSANSGLFKSTNHRRRQAAIGLEPDPCEEAASAPKAGGPAPSVGLIADAYASRPPVPS